MKKPKKWTQVYPQGTKAGDEEQKLFIGSNRQSGLARHPKYGWRSTSALVQESGLKRERVEEILDKYCKSGLVFLSPKKPDHWGYWERKEVADLCLKKEDKTIGQSDKSERIDDHLEDN